MQMADNHKYRKNELTLSFLIFFHGALAGGNKEAPKVIKVNKLQMLMYNDSRGTGGLFLTLVRVQANTEAKTSCCICELMAEVNWCENLPCLYGLGISHAVKDVFGCL